MAKPKKADVVAKLEAAGIEFDPAAKVEDLIALLPAEPAASEDQVTAPAPDDAPAEGDKGTKTVYSKTGAPMRTYSKELHGTDFAKLAKEYADKKGGTVK